MVIDRSPLKKERNDRCDTYWIVDRVLLDLISIPDNETHLNIAKINWTRVLLLFHLSVRRSWRRTRRVIMDGQGIHCGVVLSERDKPTCRYIPTDNIGYCCQCVSLSRIAGACKWMTLVTDVESIIRRLFYFALQEAEIIEKTSVFYSI